MATLPSERKPITMDTFLRGVWEENPVFVMLLGLCPALAVTNSAVNAFGMGGATIFVLVGSSALVSLLRNVIPKQVRIASYIVIIATFVTIVDYAIHALSLDLYNALGAFIQLIVVNCVILGRRALHPSTGLPSPWSTPWDRVSASPLRYYAWARCGRSWAAVPCSGFRCSERAFSPG